MTSLRRKRALRLSRKPGQRRSYCTVTGYYRHIIDVALVLAVEAKALHILIMGVVPLTDLRWCCVLRQVRDPVGQRLRNVRSGLIARPEVTLSRRITRAVHIAPGQVGNRRTQNDRTYAIRLGEIPSAAGYCIDRDMPSGPLAGRGGAERKISLAKPEIGDSLRPLRRVALSAAQLREAPQSGRILRLKTCSR